MPLDLSPLAQEELNLLYSFFPSLSDLSRKQIEQLYGLYREWNQKINVVSRKDIDHIYKHHILHSLSIAHFFSFPSGSVVADVGTGGGFPAIPLAILFPEVHFHLIDSIKKKLFVAELVASSIGLTNISIHHARCEELRLSCHYVVSRAAMAFPKLLQSSAHLITPKPLHPQMPNGLVCLKGGDLTDELADYFPKIESHDIGEWTQDDYFVSKQVIYYPIYPLTI